MDYIAGVDASQLLHHYPAGMPARQVAEIVTAVADALDYAHRHGLLHRDVKPANVMLTTPDGDDQRRVLLGDFGIARSADETSGLTATNSTVGTVAYAAPEQLMGDQIDGRADQYALAATAYHLLTGTQLFPNSNPAVVISRHLNAVPPPVSTMRPDLAALDPVLANALSKDPPTAIRHAATSPELLQPTPLTSPSPHCRHPRRKPRYRRKPLQFKLPRPHPPRARAPTAALAHPPEPSRPGLLF